LPTVECTILVLGYAVVGLAETGVFDWIRRHETI